MAPCTAASTHQSFSGTGNTSATQPSLLQAVMHLLPGPSGMPRSSRRMLPAHGKWDDDDIIFRRNDPVNASAGNFC